MSFLRNIIHNAVCKLLFGRASRGQSSGDSSVLRLTLDMRQGWKGSPTTDDSDLVRSLSVYSVCLYSVMVEELEGMVSALALWEL